MQRLTTQVICAGFAALCASGALADCPTTMADAGSGVFVDYGSYVVRYDRRPDGAVEEIEFDIEDTPGFRYVSQHGIFVLESAELRFGYTVDGTQERITYDVPPPAVIEAGMSYATNTTVFYGNDAPFNEPLSITVNPAITQTIGDCQLQALRVNMRTGPAGDEYASAFDYFPALGFGIYMGGGPIGSAPDVYQPISISTRPPVTGSAPGAAPPPPPLPPAAPAQPSK